MLKILKFTCKNTLKILIFLPIILLTINTSAMQNANNKNLQKLVKTIIISEFCLSDKLTQEINVAKLPCEGYFEYFTTKKTNKTIIYAISPKAYFTIIAGAKSYNEVQKELFNIDQKKSFRLDGKSCKKIS